MNAIDATIWAYLATDILLASATDRLPAPPRTPTFARETVRPGKRVAS